MTTHLLKNRMAICWASFFLAVTLCAFGRAYPLAVSQGETSGDSRQYRELAHHLLEHGAFKMRWPLPHLDPPLKRVRTLHFLMQLLTAGVAALLTWCIIRNRAAALAGLPRRRL